MTPFEAVYDKQPPPLIPSVDNPIEDDEAQDFVFSREEIMRKLHTNMDKVVNDMKKQANSKRSDIEFQLGDLVLVKLHKYHQQTASLRWTNKFESKYSEPFTVIERIGMVAYKLNLLTTSQIHHVFHVSLLKKFHTLSNQIEQTIPNDLLMSKEEHFYEGIEIDTSMLESILARSNRPSQTSSKLANYDVF